MPNTVQLFITCILDTFYPEIGEAVVRVLKRAGVSVEFQQGQTCCGQPAFNAGLRDEASAIARHAIKVFEKTSGPLVVPSGSCAGMIRFNYPLLFQDDKKWLPRAQALAERTYEFTEFLVDNLGVSDLGASFPSKVTYHSSCHLYREMGIDRQPRLLLQNVRDLEFVELAETTDCCGFGGVFSLEHPEISDQMMKRKISNIEASGAPLVVMCDAGCMMNINGGLHRSGKSQRAIHIAEILTKINN
jgi:L-lactate dehydrogenase complex protein LldE